MTNSNTNITITRFSTLSEAVKYANKQISKGGSTVHVSSAWDNSYYEVTERR